MLKFGTKTKNYNIFGSNVHLTIKTTNSLLFLKARSDFHLSVLESIFISRRKPNLCRQKEFVYKHKILV